MIALTLLVALSQPATVELSRGAQLQGHDTRYWACEDTTLARQTPNGSFGQGTLLTASPEHRVLLRFGDLERALGPSRRVTSAKLVLTVVTVERPGRLTLKRFGAPWFEGAGMSGTEGDGMNTTWSHQLHHPAMKLGWRNGGAGHDSQRVSAQAEVSQAAERIELTGLEEDVQQMYERWYDNHGWVIEFSGSAMFESAQAVLGKPTLVVTTEPAAPPTGPDLSVTYIQRTPEYLRYDPTGDAYVRVNVDGHESGVMMRPGNADTQKWPKDGELVTYTAMVKNVGDAPSDGCGFAWSKDWRPAEKGGIARSIAPGETVEVVFQTTYSSVEGDHRLRPVRLALEPVGADAVAANNVLEIQANALNLGIWVDRTFYERFAKEVNGSGSRAFEDWIQWQFRLWNEVLMRHSRFSFAPDGCRESVRVQRITIVPDGTLKGGAHVPDDKQDMRYDGEWGFDSSFGEAERYMDAVRAKLDRALLHEMSHQIGLIDMYQMNVDASMPDGSGGKVRLKVDGTVLTRGMIDPPAPLMGGGDTRNDNGLHRTAQIFIEGVPDVALRHALFQRTDLYSATSVFALNANVGYRRGFFGEYMYSMPNVVIVRAADRNGTAIPSGTLRFYQMKNGVIPDQPPAFEVEVRNGTAFLPNRPTGIDQPFTTVTGHTLKPNPFGRLDVVGSNGVFLVEVNYQGQREWAWLKAWQLVDAFARGNREVAILEMRFNVTHKPLKEGDWALNKVVLDSADSRLENLSLLVDGDAKTFYESQAEWIEIDIGRDRPLGEITLVTTRDGSEFWSQFDILVYSTGQRLNEARVYARELDWRRAVAFHRDVDPADPSVVRVRYRAMPQTVRFIRLVKKEGGKARLAGIEVRESEPPD